MNGPMNLDLYLEKMIFMSSVQCDVVMWSLAVKGKLQFINTPLQITCPHFLTQFFLFKLQSPPLVKFVSDKILIYMFRIISDFVGAALLNATQIHSILAAPLLLLTGSQRLCISDTRPAMKR